MNNKVKKEKHIYLVNEKKLLQKGQLSQKYKSFEAENINKWQKMCKVENTSIHKLNNLLRNIMSNILNIMYLKINSVCTKNIIVWMNLS